MISARGFYLLSSLVVGRPSRNPLHSTHTQDEHLPRPQPAPTAAADAKPRVCPDEGHNEVIIHLNKVFVFSTFFPAGCITL